jgi:hypothetical protein
MHKAFRRLQEPVWQARQDESSIRDFSLPHGLHLKVKSIAQRVVSEAVDLFDF